MWRRLLSKRRAELLSVGAAELLSVGVAELLSILLFVLRHGLLVTPCGLLSAQAPVSSKAVLNVRILVPRRLLLWHLVGVRHAPLLAVRGVLGPRVLELGRLAMSVVRDGAISISLTGRGGIGYALVTIAMAGWDNRSLEVEGMVGRAWCRIAGEGIILHAVGINLLSLVLGPTRKLQRYIRVVIPEYIEEVLVVIDVALRFHDVSLGPVGNIESANFALGNSG